jgi:hypothetical protein
MRKVIAYIGFDPDPRAKGVLSLQSKGEHQFKMRQGLSWPGFIRLEASLDSRIFRCHKYQESVKLKMQVNHRAQQLPKAVTRCPLVLNSIRVL